MPPVVALEPPIPRPPVGAPVLMPLSPPVTEPSLPLVVVAPPFSPLEPPDIVMELSVALPQPIAIAVKAAGYQRLSIAEFLCSPNRRSAGRLNEQLYASSASNARNRTPDYGVLAFCCHSGLRQAKPGRTPREKGSPGLGCANGAASVVTCWGSSRHGISHFRTVPRRHGKKTAPKARS